jgi:hypothetical protein
VLEGHAMYEGGANVLRLSYSVHRDLNVKNSGDKNRDFTMPLGVPSLGYNQYIQQQNTIHGGGYDPVDPYMHQGGPPRGGNAAYGEEPLVTGVPSGITHGTK